MNLLKFHGKAISWMVLCSFMVFLSASAVPLRGEKPAGNGNKNVAANPGTGDGSEPGMVEKASKVRKKAAARKFPWLLVAAGAVVVGAAVYFLIIQKPKYALTVMVGSGASGTPAAGTYFHKKGTSVAYDFTLQAAYKDLMVTLDGTAVAVAGTVTMDRDHTLAVNSLEGLYEDFSTTASPSWSTNHAANWSVVSGTYRCSATPVGEDWEYTLFNHAWSSANYTVTVRLKRSLNNGALGVHLGTTTNMGSACGYYFGSINLSSYAICRMNGYGYSPYHFFTGALTNIKLWENNSAINAGEQWNVYKIVRAGSSYSFYINDTALYSFSDSTYDPRYIAIVFAPVSPHTQLEVDYVTLNLISTSATLPGAPVSLSATQPAYDIAMGKIEKDK